jgi:hypothetical protein
LRLVGSSPQSAETVGRKYIINGYRQIFPTRTHPIEMTQGPAPFLQMGRIDIPSVVEDEFNDWYNTAYIPPYLKVPGCLGARRYTAIDSQPRYLRSTSSRTRACPRASPGRASATQTPGATASAPICGTISARPACIAASFQSDPKATIAVAKILRQ